MTTLYREIGTLNIPGPKFRLGQTVFTRDYAGDPNDWPLLVTGIHLVPRIIDGESGEFEIESVEWKYDTSDISSFGVVRPYDAFFESQLSDTKYPTPALEGVINQTGSSI